MQSEPYLSALYADDATLMMRAAELSLSEFFLEVICDCCMHNSSSGKSDRSRLNRAVVSTTICIPILLKTSALKKGTIIESLSLEEKVLLHNS